MWFVHWLCAFERYSPNTVVYRWRLQCFRLFIDGRRGLAVAAETSSGSWASAGAEEWHHQSGLWQRVRRRWISDKSCLPTKTDVFLPNENNVCGRTCSVRTLCENSLGNESQRFNKEVITGFVWWKVTGELTAGTFCLIFSLLNGLSLKQCQGKATTSGAIHPTL